MWNKISQAAGLSAPDAETESAEEENVASEEHEQLQQQQLMVKQLKDLLRENEKRFQDKEKELQDIANKFQKFKLQSKAKISHLTNQLKENEKSAKKEDCDFDDTSSSDSSEQSQRGKLLFLKKQLGQVKQQLEKKDEELKKITESFETRVFDLETQLNEKNILISSLADKNIADKEQENVDKSPKRESNVQEMYAQIVYKDSKILELNNQILEHEKQIMDLQEHIKEKDEVLQQRNRAVQLMAEDLSRKGQTVVSELDETRDQMKIMQENFASTELEWRNELEKQKSRIVELEKEMLEQNKKLKNTELSAKNLESARYELSVKNAELQKKIVVVQESAAKQCEMYNKEIEGELENLKKSLEAEKKHSADLQVSLDEFNTQSENKVLKARVKERTKFKALERELNALKKSNEEKPKEILELQQHIAELEEDKGSLQLKIMDYEEQIILLDKIKDDNEKLSSDLKEALNKVEQYTKQITELEADNDAWKKKFQSLEENTNLLQENLSRLSEEKHNLERKVMEKKQLERDYAILKSSHSEFENMYNETVMTLNELRDIKVSFELKNIELEEMRESDEKIRRELELQIHQLQDMLNNESKPDIQMQKEYLELKDLLQTVTQSLSFSENQIKQLSEEVEVLKSELNKKELEVNSCVKELEEKNNLLLSKEEIVGNLMSEVEKLADNVKSQTQHLSELNEIIVLRDTEISNLKSELQEKTSSELLLGEQINQFEERIQHFKSSNSEMENSFQEFNSQIIALQQSISRKDLYISELESSLQSRTVDLDALNQQLDDLHRTALDFDRLKVEQEKVVNQLKLQKQHNEELQHQILEKDNFVTKLQSELEDKSSSVSSLTLTTQKQSEKLEQLLKHQEGLTEELLSLKAKSVELTDMNSEKDDYILKLQSELQGKIATEISLTQTVQQQLDNLTQSLKQQESLSNELERLKNDQIAETEKVKSKMVSLLEQIEDLESELSRIQVDLDSKEKDLIAARSEIAQLQNEKTDLSRTFKETEDLLRKRSDLADKWELEYKNSQDEVDIVKKENDQLKCDLSERVVELSSLNQTISETKKCLVEKSDEVANLTAEFEIIKTDALNKEKTIKKLEEQNVILKQEVKHSNLSLSEKEEIYKKNMEEKLKFEANFLQLTEECELKDLTLKSKLEECELLNSKIDVLTKSIEVSENSAQNLSVELEHSQKEFLKLKTLSEEQLLDIQKKETEMLEMQKVIHELENEIIVQKEKLNNYVSTHEKQLTYSNELSNKLCLVESDLKQRDLEKEQLEQEYICLQKTFDDEANMKKELECQILNYKVEIEKISEERNHLEQKNAMYSDQISSFIAEIEKYKQQEADSNNSILCLNKLNAELTEKCNTFELAAKEFENQCKGLMEQINVLNQKCHQYEKSILEENEKALQELQVYKTLSDEQSLTIQKKEEDMVEKQNLLHQLEKEIIVQKEKLNNYVLTSEENIKKLQSELEVCKNISVKEKSEIEILYQNLFSEKNMLFASVKELETKLSNCVEENEKLKCNNIQLQDVIKEKSELIDKTESTLLDLKRALGERETECKSIQNFKEDYYLFLKHLSESLQLHTDMTCLDNAESSTDFFAHSKLVSDEIRQQIISVGEKLQTTLNAVSDYKLIEREYELSKAENLTLHTQYKGLQSDLQHFIDNLDTSSQFVEKRLSQIFSSLEFETNALDKVNLKIDTLNNILSKQASKIANLEEEKNSLEQKLVETKELLFDCEQKIRNFNELQEKANIELISENNVLKQHVSELEVAISEATSNCRLLSTDLENKSSAISDYEGKIQALSRLVEANRETITKLQQDQQNKNNSLTSLQSEFDVSQTIILSLQNEIAELKRYQNETAESHVLESSHNVSNGLQVEIDNLRKELQLIEEQKSSLLQHLENSNSQLQLCVNEKIALEAVVEQMRKKFDDLIETNKNLSNSFEETQLVLKAKEESVNILENKLQVSTRAFEELCEELERLKSLQTDSQVRESQKITALEQSVTSLKCTITDLWSTFSQIDSIRDFDFNLANLPPEFDKDSLKIITSFCSEIMRLKSLHDEEREKFQAYADECDIKNNELNEELQLLQSKLKNYETVGHSDEKSEEIQMKKDVILPVGVSQKLDKELLLQQNLDSMPVLPDYQKENESLKEEIHSLKLKSAKMLTKLKLFRDKTDKLSDDLKSAKDSNEEIRHLYNKSIKNEKDLQSVISLLKGENEMLLSKLQAMEAKQLQMVDKSNDIVSQLKERNMLLDEECSKLRKELQDYRYTWEQCSISYELQKEDNERLRTKLAQAAEEVELFKSKASELNLQLVQLEKENIHLRQETQNLQEHTKMLLSDNDTYQGLTERLTAAKSGLEQKIIDMKEKFVAEKAELEKKLDLKKSEVAETGIELRGLDELESENTSLKNLCEELKSDRQLIQRERDTYLKNKNLLEKEKLYLQQQLLEKVDEIDRINCQLQEAMSNRSQSNVQSVMDASLSGTDLIEQYEEKVNDLKEENRSLKSKLNSLTQELNLTNKKFEFLQNDIQNKESVYRDQISIAEKQLVASQQSSSSFDTKMQVPSNDANLQNELQQAMSSLHRQGLRCEELSVEVSRLLEERNNLQWRLQQCQQNTLQKSHESNLQSSECVTIEVESPSGTNFEMNQLSHSNIKLLQERLQQSEKTCQELRRANEALDQALIHERDQKRQIEEELGYAQEHLNIEAKASDEYQILLGDLDEPELFAETNFSISRNVKTHAYKFRRWLNGRKNYLYRTIKGRKYPQLIYLFYIFFIHVWLLMCIF